MKLLLSEPESGSHGRLVLGGASADNADVWHDLPVISRQIAQLHRLVSQHQPAGEFPRFLNWFQEWLGFSLKLGLPEILDRPAGLKRVGLVAEFSLPKLGTRIGVGLETPLAHAVIDRLLSFDRSQGESRLPLSPVEWGVWTLVFVKAIDQLKADMSADSSSEVRLDRVGPDSYNSDRLGKIITICWEATLGTTTGAVRFWIPESVLFHAKSSLAFPRLATDPARIAALQRGEFDQSIAPGSPKSVSGSKSQGLSSTWKALAGTVSLPRGYKVPRVGGVLPINSRSGEVAGAVELVLRMTESGESLRILARPGNPPNDRILTLVSPVQSLGSGPSENRPMNYPSEPISPVSPTPVPPAALPVTLTVELGRVNITLSRLADLKPGDVVELNRHSREPVELTSNGKVVARGELIKIDTELGIRVTNVFL